MAKKNKMAFREELSKLTGRHTFTAKVDDFGTKIEYNSMDGNPVKNTILLISVKHDDKEVAQHIWADADPFLKLSVNPHDSVKFSAVITPYEKQYRGYSITNYALSNICEVQLV